MYSSRQNDSTISEKTEEEFFSWMSDTGLN